MTAPSPVQDMVAIDAGSDQVLEMDDGSAPAAQVAPIAPAAAPAAAPVMDVVEGVASSEVPDTAPAISLSASLPLTPPPAALDDGSPIDLSPSPEAPSPDDVETNPAIDISVAGAFEVERASPPTASAPVPVPVTAPHAPAAASRRTGILRIQPAVKRAAPAAGSGLVAWTLAELVSGADPIGHGLAKLIEKGATAALFLTVSPPAPGAALPTFTASAELNARSASERPALWSGLRWDPKLVPDLWNAFVRSGVAELSPPGNETLARSNRNTVRRAFGTGADEYLLLLRCGPAVGCRGVLAVITPRSLATDLQDVLPSLSAAFNAKAAA